jgi:c-di-GMP-binding flagellar brake protein YcgR
MAKEFSGFTDRRKYARVNIHALVQYSLPSDVDTPAVQARISDISEGGVLLVTSTEGLRMNAPVKMSFVMPEGQLAIVEGKVHHTEALDKDLYQSGIEFLDLQKKDRLAIQKFVDAHPKK